MHQKNILNGSADVKTKSSFKRNMGSYSIFLFENIIN